MREQYDMINIEPGDLALKTLEHKRNGERLGQICAVRIEKGYELLYSFIKDYHMTNYKIVIDEDTEIVSISDVYPTAMLYENEMTELFGVRIKYITLDYHNKLFRLNQETPFK